MYYMGDETPLKENHEIALIENSSERNSGTINKLPNFINLYQKSFYFC